MSSKTLSEMVEAQNKRHEEELLEEIDQIFGSALSADEQEKLNEENKGKSMKDIVRLKNHLHRILKTLAEDRVVCMQQIMGYESLIARMKKNEENEDDHVILFEMEAKRYSATQYMEEYKKCLEKANSQISEINKELRRLDRILERFFDL